MKFYASIMASLPKLFGTSKVGRVTPCALFHCEFMRVLLGEDGAHGVTRPTLVSFGHYTVILFLGTVGTLLAEPNLPSTNVVLVTPQFINALADEARTNNPSLKSADRRVEAARANQQTIRTWEDPMVSVGSMQAERSMRAEDGDLIYGVEQPLPLFGKPKAARRVAESETKVEKANADFQFQQLRKEIAQAVFKTALANRALEIGEQDLAWLETMLAVTERRYEFGNATQFDVLRMQNERSKRAEQLKTDAQLLQYERVNLNRLLNRDFEAPWPRLQLPPVAAPVVYSELLTTLALKNEPKLKMMRQQIDQAAATADLTRRGRYPSFNAGAEIRNFSGNGEFRQSMVTLSFNVPWGNRKKYDAAIQRDDAKKQAVELDAIDYELGIRNDIHQLTVKIDAARREALLYRDQILPRSEIALKSAHGAWESNTGMFRDLLDARRMLLDAQLMNARAISEQYQMLSELVLCCGLGDLEALQTIGAQLSEKVPQTKK